ncbi:MAG: hypothetical protein ACREJG_00135 [Candidatus Rokuibacteriota bacterium]
MKRLLVAVLAVAVMGVQSPVFAAPYDMTWFTLCVDRANPDRVETPYWNSGRWTVDLARESDARYVLRHDGRIVALFDRYGDGSWQATSVDLPFTGGGCPAARGYGAFSFSADDRGIASFIFDGGWPGSMVDGGADQRAAGVRLVTPTRMAPSPPPPTTGASIALSLGAGQVVSGTVPVKIATTGLSGTLRYYISVDGAQKWYWSTTATTITQWWGTRQWLNGTHTVSVRAVDGAGKSGTASVQVVVRN